VFVRPLSMEEGRRLQRISRTAKDPVRLRRAIVVMMSGQGQTVPDITSLLQVGDDYVRDVIHAVNQRGFDALDPKWSGGRPRRIGEQVREWICLIARTAPADRGITAFSTWSLANLRDHLLAQGIVAAISRETLRRILRDGGVSWQTTTTWKASTDPDFIAKMRRILDLYDHPPADGPVVCVAAPEQSSRPVASTAATAPTPPAAPGSSSLTSAASATPPWTAASPSAGRSRTKSEPRLLPSRPGSGRTRSTPTADTATAPPWPRSPTSCRLAR
jgi:transposase